MILEYYNKAIIPTSDWYAPSSENSVAAGASL